ncbi:37488_t:CDS:2, partial [Gigaspora margarita]
MLHDNQKFPIACLLYLWNLSMKFKVPSTQYSTFARPPTLILRTSDRLKNLEFEENEYHLERDLRA